MPDFTKDFNDPGRMRERLAYTKVRDVKDPQRGTPGSAGIDVFVPNDLDKAALKETGLANTRISVSMDGETFDVPPHSSVLIPSGLHFNIPDGYALIAYNKSGIAVKKGFDIGASVCDSDYHGEVHISLTNTTDSSITFNRGDKIVQFLLVPVDHRALQQMDSLEELYAEENSQRGSGGFGSTGTQ